MSEESRFIGFTALLVRACFHARDDNSLSSRSPEQFAQDHSLVLGLLFRVPSLSSPALTLSGVGLTARVSTLFATSPGASTLSRTSQALDTFRPQVFTTSRRLSPHTALGLVSSHSRVQGAHARSGASHLRAAIVSSSERSAPLPLRSPAARQDESWRPRSVPSASRP